MNACCNNGFKMVYEVMGFKMWMGLIGPPGPPGKSAYEAAVEGGYTGTEEQFNAALAEIDTALQPSDVDAALSDSSENPVQNRVVTAALDGKAGIIRDTASGDVATVTPDASIDRVSVAIEADADHASATSATVYRRGKNLIPQSFSVQVPGYSVTVNGITYTFNDDMSITADGTADGDSSINLTGSASTTHIALPYGNFILSGCPAGGSAETYALRIRTQNIGGGGTNFLRDTGEGVSFPVSETREAARVYIEIKSGTTVENLVFFPMIRLAAEDSSYAPWGAVGGATSQTVELAEGAATVELEPVPGLKNNVWSNVGPVTVEYAADLKTYIDSKIAAAVAALS